MGQSGMAQVGAPQRGDASSQNECINIISRDGVAFVRGDGLEESAVQTDSGWVEWVIWGLFWNKACSNLGIEHKRTG